MNELELRIQPLVAAIERLLQLEAQVFVGIDGMAASGKTTIAQRLAEAYDANVIHIDDFFLPKHLRTPQREQEIGGNIHYERFREEVVLGLAAKGPFEYRVFRCSQMDYIEVKKVLPKQLNIIEGAYSLHPRLGISYDLRVFSEVSRKAQGQRLLKRNGEQGRRIFEQVWIPKEEQYFAYYGIKEQCDVII
jgi:uridine kinase